MLTCFHLVSAGLLKELTKRELEKKIMPDPDIDAFIKVSTQVLLIRFYLWTDFVVCRSRSIRILQAGNRQGFS